MLLKFHDPCFLRNNDADIKQLTVWKSAQPRLQKESDQLSTPKLLFVNEIIIIQNCLKSRHFFVVAKMEL